LKKSLALKKSLLLSSAFVLGMSGVTSIAHAAPVEYVRICSLYGAGFHYVPGTDVCMNDYTGDARQQTEGGTWRSLLPYPQGHWVTNVQSECAPAKLVKLGTFKSTDFTPNLFDRKETAPVSLPLKPGQFITKVIMSGGFYDPRVPARAGAPSNDPQGLCVRSKDPNVLEVQGSSSVNPPYGTLPIGCVDNQRIVNMPGAYSIAATAAYPEIDTYFSSGDQTVVSGPYTYGSQLVVTTDIGNSGPTSFVQLTYADTTSGSPVVMPLAGTLSVSACVDSGTPGQ
jgi:hypothetical protein